MVYDEADLQSLFTPWARSRSGVAWLLALGATAAACELKHVFCKRGDCGAGECRATLPFSHVEKHQERSLLRSAHGDGSEDTPAMVHKISDSAVGFKPYDCFIMSRAHACLVVGWQCGDRLAVYTFHIDDWLRFKGERARGSMSEAEARRIGQPLDLNCG